MRQLFEHLREELIGFIAQRDHVLLEVACRDEDAPLVFKLLGDLDSAQASDLFMLCLDDFTTPAEYVGRVLAAVRVQLATVAEDLAAQGRPPLAALPPTLEDSQTAPAQRLIGLIEHVRGWLPAEGGHRVIWGLFPCQVADRPTYLGFLAELMREGGTPSWMRATRLVVRAPRDAATPLPDPRSRRIIADFSPAALQAALTEEAADERLSEAQRCQALLTLAQLDSAHGRAAAARLHFTQVIRRAERLPNQTLHALALNGLGELAHREGNLPAARAYYECAVEPACGAGAPVLLALLSRNLGDLAFLQSRYAEAEKHYDAWQRLAAHTLDAEGRVQALQKRALAQLRLTRASDGRESLESAATLGRSLQLWGLHRYTLEELSRLYGQLGEVSLRRTMEQELKALPAQEFAHG